MKSPDLLDQARELFGTQVKITLEGKRHIGAALGAEEFACNFIKDKVEAWVGDVQELVSIAKDQPQAALCAFNIGISQSIE